MMIMTMTLIGNYDIKDSGDSQIQTTKFFVTDLPIERSLRFHNTLYPSRLLGSRSKEAAVKAEVTLAVNIAMTMRPIIIQMMENIRATIDLGDLSP